MESEKNKESLAGSFPEEEDPHVDVNSQVAFDFVISHPS